MTISPNPATALYNLLQQVKNSQGTTIQKGWELVLGQPVGTAEFARRHAAVVMLFTDVHQRVLGLAKHDQDRERYLQYIPRWYDAVVPRTAWSSVQRPATGLIDSTILDHLAGLGTLFRLMDQQSSETVTADAAHRLRTALGEWRMLLVDADLPPLLHNEIRGHIDHIEWLLDNIRLFGSNPVIASANQLFGCGVKIMGTRRSAVKRAGAAMAAVVAFLASTQTGIDTTNDLLAGLTEMREHAQELIQGPQHTLDDQPRLPAAPITDEATVHDAEIIEDHPHP
ncbi:hypothetical protein [Nocardia wallacei]|uniref:hypothetical protein n=1 Tax=Nocardia wallacei TaxID=480035 RepID=UPI002454DA69|nr:hypothetical protein [Nocardia wallacei]